MILIHILIIVGIAFFVFRKEKKAGHSRIFWSSLLLKLGGGILVGLFYSYIIGNGDTLVYDQEARKYTALFTESAENYTRALVGLGSDDFIESLVYNERPRALFFTKILSVVYLFTQNNYWISSLYFSIFSFIGLWYMVNALSAINPIYRWPAYLSFLFYPSMLFWSSGILKETLLMGLLGFIMYLTLKKWERVNPGRILTLLFLWITVWYLKYYIAAVFFPFWFVILIGSLHANNILPIRVIRYSAFLIPVILILISFTHTNLNLSRVMGIVLDNHYEVIEMSNGENYIHLDLSTPWGVIKSLPKIYFLGWFGPLTSNDSFVAILASIENSIVLAILVWFLIKSRETTMHGQQWLIIPLLFIILISTFFLTLSTPVYGTLLRYKVAYSGFFLWLLLINHPINYFLNKKFPYNP